MAWYSRASRRAAVDAWRRAAQGLTWQSSGLQAGITRSGIRDLFDRNKSKAEIDAALGLLVSTGQVERNVLAGTGRPAEIWSPRPGAPTRR